MLKAVEGWSEQVQALEALCRGSSIQERGRVMLVQLKALGRGVFSRWSHVNNVLHVVLD